MSGTGPAPGDGVGPSLEMRADAALDPPMLETSLAFYSRRALEESRHAASAATPQAAAAHRYLAAAYSARIAKELAAEDRLVELLRNVA